MADSEFEVEVTINFKTNVLFSDVDSDAITMEDAMVAFLGYGLNDMFESSEYDMSVVSQKVTRHG